VFGGIYLPHLRREVYRNLSAAEEPVRKPGTKHARADIDCDGREEVALFSDSLAAYFRPAIGGAAVEIAFPAAGVNVADCMTRRREPYHEAIEQKTGERLPADWYPRACFIDHVLRGDADLAGFARCEYPEQGDFVLGSYNAVVTAGRLRLEREAGVWVAGEYIPVRLTKTIRLSGERLQCDYQIANTGAGGAHLCFGCEMCLGAASPEHDAVRLFVDGGERLSAGSTGERKAVAAISLHDGLAGWRADLAFAGADRLWWFPLETYSQSESGYDKLYQATIVLPIWNLYLAPGASWKGSVAMAVAAPVP
jgi:hypothetical protein